MVCRRQRAAVIAVFLSFCCGNVNAQPSIETVGDDIIVSAPANGRVLFKVGEDQVVDIGELALSVAGLQTQLNDALQKIDEAKLSRDDTAKAQAAASVKAAAMATKVGVVESDLDVLEGRMVKVAGLVANMSDCDQLGLHHDEGGVCTRSDSWSCGKLVVKGGAASVKGEAFIGTVARITCDDGAFIEGSEQVTCLGSGSAASGAHWGLPLTGGTHMPTCSSCMTACKTCSDAKTCDTCPNSGDVWSPVGNKCITNKARSCKQLLDRKQLPGIPQGKTYLDVTVKLYPDVANDPTLSVTATCHIVLEPHDNKVYAYTSIMCDRLSSTTQCIPLPKPSSPSTCAKYGYIAGPARSERHLKQLATLTRLTGHQIQGVSREGGGRPQGYGSCAMADPKVFGPMLKKQNTEACTDWKAIDGGQWFLRDKGMDLVGQNDPGKDYCLGGFLMQGSLQTRENGMCVDPKDTAQCAQFEKDMQFYNQCSAQCKYNCKQYPSAYYERVCGTGNWFTDTREGKDLFARIYKCSVDCEGLRLYDTWAQTGGDAAKCAEWFKISAKKMYVCSTKDF